MLRRIGFQVTKRGVLVQTAQAVNAPSTPAADGRSGRAGRP
jgi:hypothetical protein